MCGTHGYCKVYWRGGVVLIISSGDRSVGFASVMAGSDDTELVGPGLFYCVFSCKYISQT